MKELFISLWNGIVTLLKYIFILPFSLVFKLLKKLLKALAEDPVGCFGCLIKILSGG